MIAQAINSDGKTGRTVTAQIWTRQGSVANYDTLMRPRSADSIRAGGKCRTSRPNVWLQSSPLAIPADRLTKQGASMYALYRNIERKLAHEASWT
ncbi:MAG: hypothetical protein ACREXY_16785, partial [Gammaproteobacteria bacterium]